MENAISLTYLFAILAASAQVRSYLDLPINLTIMRQNVVLMKSIFAEIKF